MGAVDLSSLWGARCNVITVSPQSVHYSSNKVERLVSYFDEDESVMAYVANAILDLAGKPVL